MFNKPTSNRYSTFLFIILLGVTCFAHAEKGDREKPINIESNHVTVDDQKQTSVFEGNVILTQGTIVMRADRMIVKQDKKGFKQGTAYGNPVSFRQKRDGMDEYIEGFGQRIEYDGNSEKIEFFSRARIKRGHDEVNGNYISYNSKTEYFQVVGKGTADSSTSTPGRARAVIQPQKKENTPENPPAPETNPTPQGGSAPAN